MDAASGTPEAVRVFLEHGVDVNARSSKGYSALECAAINRTHGPAILRMLLEAGADPTHRDSQERTARDLAVERGAIENVPVLDAWQARTPPRLP